MVDPRALGTGVGAGGTGVDCPDGVLAFRRPLGPFETLGSGLDASNAASEDVEGLRARPEESI
jgi:hypothetical protein